MLASQGFRDGCLFVVLVLLGVAGRFVCLDIPNFSPTASIAVFAGFYFSRRRLAVAVPLAVMLFSNFWLDAYTTWGELLVVYGAFLFPVYLSRGLCRRRDGRFRLSPAGMATCCVAPSIVFFVTTNFAVWLFNGIYAPTVAGLVTCLVHALPFYQYTLAGDLLFTPALIGGYYLLRYLRAACAFEWPARPASVRV